MRTFIAIELDDICRRPLLNLIQNDLPRARDVRWCTPQQLHLTLKFLGEISDSQLPSVCQAATTACAAIAPFPIRIAGLGCFPGPRNPRVLWCGIDDPEQGCQRWVTHVDPLLEQLGFKPETRAFTPHITLGRSRSTAGGHVIQQVLETVAPPDTDTMTVTRVIVFESHLRPGGAVYQQLAGIPLADSA